MLRAGMMSTSPPYLTAGDHQEDNDITNSTHLEFLTLTVLSCMGVFVCSVHINPTALNHVLFLVKRS